MIRSVVISREQIGEAGCILVARGDVGRLKPGTVRKLADRIIADNKDAAVLYAVADDPAGYGRIVRDEYGDVKATVDEADATPEQLMICEVDASACCFHRDMLLFALDHMPCDNGRESFLADAIAIIANIGGKVTDVKAELSECIHPEDRTQHEKAYAIRLYGHKTQGEEIK